MHGVSGVAGAHAVTPVEDTSPDPGIALEETALSTTLAVLESPQ